MEDKIKVGEYVRTETEYIGQIHKISTYKINKKDKTIYLTNFNMGSYGIIKPNIKKHSFNIIDLIEERRLCKWRENNRYLEWK